MSLYSREDRSQCYSESAAHLLNPLFFGVAAVTSKEVNSENEIENKTRSNSSTSGNGSDTKLESKTGVENTEDDALETSVSLSNETRERLCLKAEPAQSDDIVPHPVLIAEWNTWLRKGLYEGDEEENKKREEEESKLRDEIMKKFPRGAYTQKH